MTKQHQLLCIIGLIIIGGLTILAIVAIAMLLVSGEPVSRRIASPASLSNTHYTIQFARDSVINNGETQFQVYSIRTDGSSLAYEKTVSTATWEAQLGEQRIIESMGNYFGETSSPDRTKQLKIETGVGGWFSYFTTPRIYLEQNKNKKLLWDTGVGELLWLPDSERLVFTSDSTIFMMNSTTGEYAPLVDGLGFIKIETL